MAKKYSSNDNRSNAMNTNNPAFKTAQDNRFHQLNRNNSRYQGKDDKIDK